MWVAVTMNPLGSFLSGTVIILQLYFSTWYILYITRYSTMGERVRVLQVMLYSNRVDWTVSS